MSEKKKTHYVGSGKRQNEKWIKATINAAKLEGHLQEYKGHKFYRLDINIKDQPYQYGKDISISIDDFTPESKQESDEMPF